MTWSFQTKLSLSIFTQRNCSLVSGNDERNDAIFRAYRSGDWGGEGIVHIYEFCSQRGIKDFVRFKLEELFSLFFNINLFL